MSTDKEVLWTHQEQREKEKAMKVRDPDWMIMYRHCKAAYEMAARKAGVPLAYKETTEI